MKTFHTIAFGTLVASLLATGSAEAAEGWARSSSLLRAGPGTAYPAITRVSAGEGLSVHGCLRRWSWCDVSVDGDRGWFPGNRIALLRDGRRVVLPSIAAVVGLGVLGFERDLYWRDHYRGRPFYDRDRPRWTDGRPDRPPYPGPRGATIEVRPDAGVPRPPMPVETRRHHAAPPPPGRAAMPERVMPERGMPGAMHDRGRGGAHGPGGRPCRPGDCG